MNQHYPNYLKDYLLTVLLVPRANIYYSKSQVFIKTDDLTIRIKYRFSNDEMLVFQVKKKTAHYFRTAICLARENPGNWFSCAVRFIVASIILQAKQEKIIGKLREFAFADTYKKLILE